MIPYGGGVFTAGSLSGRRVKCGSAGNYGDCGCGLFQLKPPRDQSPGPSSSAAGTCNSRLLSLIFSRFCEARMREGQLHQPRTKQLISRWWILPLESVAQGSRAVQRTSGLRPFSPGKRPKCLSAVHNSRTPWRLHSAAIRVSCTCGPVTGSATSAARNPGR